MTEQSIDPSGDARDAVATAVRDYGTDVLSNPTLLDNLFKDLLPDSPREASVLVAAAEAGVASLLADQVRAQMDPATAVRLTAATLGERRALDPGACQWAAATFARALGYDVGPGGSASAPPSSGTEVVEDGWGAPVPGLGGARLSDEVTQSVVAPPAAPPSSPGSPPYSPPYSPAAPYTPSGSPSPPYGTGSYSPPYSPGTTYQPAGPGYPPPAPGPGGGQPGGRRTGALIAAAVLVIIAGYLGIAAATGSPPFSKHASTESSFSIPSDFTTTSTGTTPTTTTPNPGTGRVALGKLLPNDVAGSTCGNAPPGQTVQGMIATVHCVDSGLAGGNIFGYQFDNAADLTAGLALLNNNLGFDRAGATSSCPPSGAAGLVTWDSDKYPTRNDQVIECFLSASPAGRVPTYVWTIPSQDAFMDAVTTGGTSFGQLDTWWTDHAGPFSP